MNRKNFLTILTTIFLLVAIVACIVIIRSGSLVISRVKNTSPETMASVEVSNFSVTSSSDTEFIGEPINFASLPTESPIKTFVVSADPLYQECDMYIGYTYKVVSENGEPFIITADPEIATVTDKNYVIPLDIGAAVLWQKNGSGQWSGSSIFISDENSFRTWSNENTNICDVPYLNIGSNIVSVSSSDPYVARVELVNDKVYVHTEDKVGRCEVYIEYVLKPSQTIIVNNVGVFSEYYEAQESMALELARQRGIE